MRYPRVVHKYHIPYTKEIELMLPENSKLLHFAMQENKMYLWIEHTTNTSNLNIRLFRVIGTGQQFDGIEVNHIGSVITPDLFVWHLYEVLDAY